jgi:hypothetical protein
MNLNELVVMNEKTETNTSKQYVQAIQIAILTALHNANLNKFIDSWIA